MESIDNQCIEYWRQKSNEYEWMFLEQQDICRQYRLMIEELQKELKEISKYDPLA